jgi:hypothetical protein
MFINYQHNNLHNPLFIILFSDSSCLKRCLEECRYHRRAHL